MFTAGTIWILTYGHVASFPRGVCKRSAQAFYRVNAGVHDTHSNAVVERVTRKGWQEV